MLGAIRTPRFRTSGGPMDPQTMLNSNPDDDEKICSNDNDNDNEHSIMTLTMV